MEVTIALIAAAIALGLIWLRDWLRVAIENYENDEGHR